MYRHVGALEFSTIHLPYNTRAERKVSTPRHLQDDFPFAPPLSISEGLKLCQRGHTHRITYSLY